MFLKRKNIVVEISDENQAKIKEYLENGYNEYKLNRVEKKSAFSKSKKNRYTV